jgi:Family of unknown function (DUF5519)
MLKARILSLAGVEERKSRWGDRAAYWIASREFSHFQSEDLLDIRVGRKTLRMMQEIGLDPRLVPSTHVSDWIHFWLGKPNDVNDAFELVKLAWRDSRSAKRQP